MYSYVISFQVYHVVQKGFHACAFESHTRINTPLFTYDMLSFFMDSLFSTLRYFQSHTPTPFISTSSSFTFLSITWEITVWSKEYVWRYWNVSHMRVFESHARMDCITPHLVFNTYEISMILMDSLFLRIRYCQSHTLIPFISTSSSFTLFLLLEK